MPTLRCPGCGKAVKFEGLAGVCPHCASVVRVPKTSAPKPAASTTDAAPPRTSRSGGRPSHGGVNLNDLDALGEGEEVFEPTSTATQGGGSPFAALASLDKRLLYSIFGAIFLVTVFGLYVVLRKPASDDATVTPPPPTVTYHVPAPTPKPDLVVSKPMPKPAEITQPTAAPIVTQATSRPSWAALVPVLPAVKPEAINDKMIEDSIKKGVAFLKGQFQDGVLTDANNNGESHSGGDALAVLALLHSGQAIEDPDLQSSSSFVNHILSRVKEFPMDNKDPKPIYERALRTAALSMFDRDADRDQLAKDRQWLLEAEVGGAYGYLMPPAGGKTKDWATDNSTSQYGVLGIWAAATAGQPIPDKYWSDVEKHWLSAQDTDGGWGYTNNSSSTPTMTCAGVTTLCVAAEFESASVTTKSHAGDARPAFSRAVDKGLAILDKGDTIMDLGLFHGGYTLFTIERAALATGLRWFGKHDWFRELGADVIKTQKDDGSWDNGDGIDVSTSFSLLFLSRGRQPLLMDKLRFAGDWDNRPRDVAKIAQFCGAQLEKPFAWGVADLNRDWWDWLEAPVLFISTDAPPTFTDEECGKLRSYVQAGGLIFLHNEFGSKEVDAFADDLAKRLFPAYPMTAMAPDDTLFNDVFPMKVKPAMKVVSNGSRTLLVYSPKDITQEWVRYRPRDAKQNPALQLGLNLFVDGAGKSDYRNRLNTPYVGAPEEQPLATIPIYQVKYPGPWNPEPGVQLRFPRWFQKQTSLSLGFEPTDIRALSVKHAPVAMMTGNADVDFSQIDTHALNDYVLQGGVLFIDSTGGNKAFAKAMHESLFPTAFPGARLSSIPAGDPILSGAGPCTDSIPKPHVRNYTASTLTGPIPRVQYAVYGKGTIIVSDLDVTTGLLNSGTYGINGYTPDYCQSLVKNVILWAVSRYRV